MRRLAAAVLLLSILSACGGSGGGSPAVLHVFPASFDLSAGRPSRFLAGLGTGRNLFISGGEVRMRFFFLGEDRDEGESELVTETTASFLPLPGEENEPIPQTPTAAAGTDARGVYRVEEMTFDRHGLWEVEVTAELADERVLAGRGAFEVLPEPLVPAPGESAPRTDNLTVDSKGVPQEAIDSRAATEGRVPDPELHQTTIADAIRAGRPVLAVFSTPVYCVSKFCGPVTDMVAELASEYGDRAAFIHVEIWRDFQNLVANEAAAEWLLLDDGSLQEPFVFLIDVDGRIVARWDNVATRQEIEPLLRDLPTGR
ncbi:MAG: TlpA family protein disulfide reductase [Actinomycetota bacterium]